MKIKRGEYYCVDVYEESHNIYNHRKKHIGELKFTGLDLIDAIISAGMPDVYLTKSIKKNREEEIFFKIKLFETYVVSSLKKGNMYLSFDTSRKDYLDSTEIGAINYWIGMVLITLLGKKKYDYDFMVHLSMIELFSSKINIKKRTYFSTNGKITFKSPDLLAINRVKNTYGVFEAKGYSNYSSQAMEHGYEQAKSIKRINGKSPKNSLVVMTQTGTKEIRMIEKDPEGEGCEININVAFLHLYHYLPIVELIMELSHEKRGNWLYGSLTYGDDRYSVGILLSLYEELVPIVQCMHETETSCNEMVCKILSKETGFINLISDNSNEKIFNIE